MEKNSKKSTSEIDIEKVLDAARKNQWSIDDYDWSTPIKPKLTRLQRKRLGQILLFAAGVERMGGDAFSNHARYIEDSAAKTLCQLNALDELRHADAETAMAKRLGSEWPDLPWTVRWMFKEMHGEMRRAARTEKGRLLHAFGSSGILIAELGLDSIFLPMLKLAMDDPMQNEVWRRIDQDERRHIALDYWLIEYRANTRRKSKTKEGFASGRKPKSAAYPFPPRAILAMVLGMGTMTYLMRDMPFKADFYKNYWSRLLAVPEKAPHATENSGYVQTVDIIQRSIDYLDDRKKLRAVLGKMMGSRRGAAHRAQGSIAVA